MRSTIVMMMTIVLQTPGARSLGKPPDGYAFYALGGPGIPTSMNDSGMVVTSGETGDPENLYSLYLWTNGTIINLSDYWQDGVFSQGGRIANSHAVALRGYSLKELADNVFLLDDGEVTEMEFPKECSDIGDPEAISSDGSIIAGDCRFDDQDELPERLVVYDTTTTEAELIGLPSNAPEASEASPYGMNDNGAIVGILDYNDETERRAFIYQYGVMSEFENPWGGLDTALLDINNVGLAVGEGDDDLGVPCALTYDIHTQEVTCIGNGHPGALNDRGHAVGWQNIDFVTHAVLFADGQTIDLNPFLPSDHVGPIADWINNYGWITGYSDVDFEHQVWLLVPIYNKGDYDGDGDVDHQDFGKFQECFAAEPYQGPEGGLHVGCSVFDFDDNVALDLTDYAAFQTAFTGPTAPDLNPYGPG